VIKKVTEPVHPFASVTKTLYDVPGEAEPAKLLKTFEFCCAPPFKEYVNPGVPPVGEIVTDPFAKSKQVALTGAADT
jgi:hypothetical protein